MEKSILKEKSYAFAIRIVKLYQFLCDEKKEYVLSKQILRSGTAIGALVLEAEFGQSRADFRSKMSIALKEANETDYWLNLLKDTNFLNEKMFKSMSDDCIGLIKMLVATIKTTKMEKSEWRKCNFHFSLFSESSQTAGVNRRVRRRRLGTNKLPVYRSRNARAKCPNLLLE